LIQKAVQHMTYAKLRAGLGALTIAIAAPALAQAAPPAPAPAPAPAPGGSPLMRDPFGDATVLRKDAEAQAAARFAALDSDKDGSLSPAELAAMRPARSGGEPRRGMGGGMGRGGMARMMDTNGDGKVSKDEFIAMTLRRFDMMDTNHDGQLTKAEREAAFAAMRARMEERMRERMQSGAEMGGGDSGGGD
jgi:Ca2+-binding EF-hand superfamily protein